MARGRPPLDPGTFGKITTTRVGEAKYVARARFRDRDAVVRSVVKYGQTISDAEKALKRALRDRQHEAEADAITPSTTVATLAEKWLTTEGVTSKAPNTIATYRYITNNHVVPQLGAFRLRELRVSDINSALTRIRAKAGPGSAKTAKTALSGMFGLAVDYQALPTNPMRDTANIKGTGRRGPLRVLTEDEATDLCDRLRSDKLALPDDLADLVDWMLGTGCRIGEALAARHGVNESGEPLLDLDAGTWEINATLIRVGGVRRRRTLEANAERTWEEEEELRALSTLAPGLHIQQRTKTDAGWRRIALPWYCVDMAQRRQAELRFRPDVADVVFPSPRGKALRDPRNTSREWREARTRLGYDWVNSHKFRATVVSRLLAAGVDPVRVADHVGHARPSMTLDRYAGRNVVSSDAARILGPVAPGSGRVYAPPHDRQLRRLTTKNAHPPGRRMRVSR